MQICIPTLNQYEHLNNCINSIVNAYAVEPLRFDIIDNGGNLKKSTLNDLININIYRPNPKWDVNKCFNHFLHKYIDESFILIVNDDTLAQENTISKLICAAHDNPDQIMFCPSGPEKDLFSFFLVRPAKMLSEIGEFPNIYKNYHADRSLLRRMKLKGKAPMVLDSCSYTHVDGGSKTIKNTPGAQITEQFRTNEVIYLKEWGGPPNDEKFKTPFNLPEN